MLFETLGQAQVFLAIAGCGAVAAALYDMMDAARHRLGKAGARIAEALFVAAVCALLMRMMVCTGQGGLRGYVLLGTAVGWFLYACTVSVAVHRVSTFLRGIWRKIHRADG